VHLNATGGFAGFVEQLGPMMRRMGAGARTDYDWDEELVSRIHERLAGEIPVVDIARWQGWRDCRIRENRLLQDEGETSRPDKSGYPTQSAGRPGKCTRSGDAAVDGRRSGCALSRTA